MEEEEESLPALHTVSASTGHNAQTRNTEIILLQTENRRLLTSHTEILPGSHAGAANGRVLYNHTHTDTHPRKDDA